MSTVDTRFVNTTRWIFATFGEDHIRFEDGIVISIDINNIIEYKVHLAKIESILNGEPRNDYPITTQLFKCSMFEIKKGINPKNSHTNELNDQYNSKEFTDSLYVSNF